MTHSSTPARGRTARQILLMPAVVMMLMVAAAPAGASRVNHVGISKSASTAAIVKQHAHARPLRRIEFGRKVG
jgi:hypothetical protein